MPAPYTDETAIINGICACLTPILSDILTTLQQLRDANHIDLTQVNTDLVAFAIANHADITTFAAANHVDLTQVDTDLVAFRAANHTDLTQVDTDLLAFKTANHADFDRQDAYLNDVVGELDPDVTLSQLMIHTHNRHEHGETARHVAHDYSIEPTGNLYGPDNPIATFVLEFGQAVAAVLVLEFFGSEDLDFGAGGGNSIYGREGGFQIDLSDPSFPVMLEGIHEHPSFVAPPLTLSWAAYLASLQSAIPNS